MVAPKFKALELDNLAEIEDALNEYKRLRPNQDKIKLLINKFNEVHGAELITLSKFNVCGDCQTAIKSFWNYVIIEWKKK